MELYPLNYNFRRTPQDQKGGTMVRLYNKIPLIFGVRVDFTKDSNKKNKTEVGFGNQRDHCRRQGNMLSLGT